MILLPAVSPPLMMHPDEHDSSQEEPVANRSRKLRVLVVEDNPDTALAMGEVLEIWGHEVRIAYDGYSAVDVALAYQPEVILLDIGLPGMDGYQVARTLRLHARFDSTLMVAITGYGQAEDKVCSNEAGINYHFTKPIELATLQELLAGGLQENNSKTQ